MIELSVPLHIEWTGGVPVPTYLDRLRSLGIKAVEVQLPPRLAANACAAWEAAIDAARARGFRIGLHAPLVAEHPCWPLIRAWATHCAGTLIVHGCTNPDRATDVVAQTINFVQHLLALLPPTVMVAVEQGWNRATPPASWLHEIWRNWQQRMRQSQRPVGVGSGMGAASTFPRAQDTPADTFVDPPLDAQRQRRRYSGTGTRAATLHVVEHIDRSNCTIAWDVAHDWLGGRGDQRWSSRPDAAFLQRVGYVRLHDIDAHGNDHCPLVVGTVPYTSQLRALWRYGFTGTVCVATRYTAGARAFGDRWHVLERSLVTARHVLKIH